MNFLFLKKYKNLIFSINKKKTNNFNSYITSEILINNHIEKKENPKTICNYLNILPINPIEIKYEEFINQIIKENIYIKNLPELLHNFKDHAKKIIIHELDLRNFKKAKNLYFSLNLEDKYLNDLINICVKYNTFTNWAFNIKKRGSDISSISELFINENETDAQLFFLCLVKKKCYKESLYFYKYYIEGLIEKNKLNEDKIFTKKFRLFEYCKKNHIFSLLKFCLNDIENDNNNNFLLKNFPLLKDNFEIFQQLEEKNKEEKQTNININQIPPLIIKGNFKYLIKDKELSENILSEFEYFLHNFISQGNKDTENSKEIKEVKEKEINDLMQLPKNFEIKFIEEIEQMEEIKKGFKDSEFIGIDSEWVPFDYIKCASIIQISNSKVCYIIRYKNLKGKIFSEKFIEIFKDKIFLSFSFKDDLKMLDDILLREFFNTENMIDLFYYKDKFDVIQEEKIFGLAKITKYFLGKTLCKKYNIGNWDEWPLKKEKINYAALDAFVLEPIYKEMKKLNVNL